MRPPKELERRVEALEGRIDAGPMSDFELARRLIYIASPFNRDRFPPRIVELALGLVPSERESARPESARPESAEALPPEQESACPEEAEALPFGYAFDLITGTVFRDGQRWQRVGTLAGAVRLARADMLGVGI